MSDVMMTIGEFGFSIDTAQYQQLQEDFSWRFDRTPLFNARPATQYLGVGDEKKTLSGVIWGGTWGKFSSLETLKSIANSGEAHSLIDGAGNVLGEYIIPSMSKTSTYFFQDGTARKADFTIELERVA